MQNHRLIGHSRRVGKSAHQDRLIAYCKENHLSLLITGDPTRLLTTDGEWQVVEPSRKAEFVSIDDVPHAAAEKLLTGEIGTFDRGVWMRVSPEPPPPIGATKVVTKNSYGPPARGRGGKVKRW